MIVQRGAVVAHVVEVDGEFGGMVRALTENPPNELVGGKEAWKHFREQLFRNGLNRFWLRSRRRPAARRLRTSLPLPRHVVPTRKRFWGIKRSLHPAVAQISRDLG